MKKALSLLLALCLLLPLCPALADGGDSQSWLPQEISDFFAQDAFADGLIPSYSYAELEIGESGFAFVVLERGAERVLYGFEKKEGVWRYWLKNASLLPQRTETTYVLSTYWGWSCPNAPQRYMTNNPILSITNSAGDWMDFEYSGGAWNLIYLSGESLSMLAQADRLVYLNENGTVQGTVYGTPQRNLRYVDYSALPLSLQAAREKLTTPPQIPSNSQLTAVKIKFTGGQKFPVYSGPGAYYEREAGGKAAVSTNDWLQVFGRESGYLLIQYAISASQMRFGYITETALPDGTSVNALQLDYADARILSDTFLTDDPLNSQARIRNLSAGEKVQWLAVMGDWVYAEVSGATPARGFVPARAISKITRQSYAASFQNGEYSAQATVSLEDGNQFTAVVTVSGPEGWSSENAVTGFQLYANQAPLTASLNARKISDTGWNYAFTLTGTLPANTVLLGLCPFRGDTLRADETITIVLSN